MKNNQLAKRKYQLFGVFTLVMMFLLTGCGSIQVGRDFDLKAFENMAKVGHTTKAQVREVLGAPKSTGVSINSEGERLVEWLYFYATGKVSAMENAGLKILQLRFQQNGKLESYNWSDNEK